MIKIKKGHKRTVPLCRGRFLCAIVMPVGRKFCQGLCKKLMYYDKKKAFALENFLHYYKNMFLHKANEG